MSDISIERRSGGKKTLSSEALETLRQAMRGQLALPGQDGYASACTIWNAMIEKHPAVVARCAGVADVLRCVAFAREHDLLLGVRGGGHNIAGNALCDGGFQIDLSLLRSVRVDRTARRAQVEPGCTLSDFDHEAQAFGLATPLGINSTTGVAGLTLGGGFGWLTRKYGMSVDNLESADVVTANAELVRASKEQNPDLFWALRGGGGNFGIVTNFEFRLHPVGPNVLSGLVVFPFDQARTVLGKYRELAPSMSEDLNVWVVVRKAPPLPFLPAAVHGKEIVAFAVFYAGDPEKGRKEIEPVRSFGKAHGEHIGVQPYAAWQRAFDPLLTPGARNYWKSHNFTELAGGAIDTIIEYAGKLPSPQTEIFIGMLGGFASRVRADATAYASRDARFVMNVHGRWERPQDDERVISWAREFFRKSEPYASGSVYVNFLTEDEGDRIQAAYGPNYRRLVEIKKKLDPDNLFRQNQNIAPRA
jgi:FAD/FMN-containing dehydrogenase